MSPFCTFTFTKVPDRMHTPSTHPKNMFKPFYSDMETKSITETEKYMRNNNSNNNDGRKQNQRSSWSGFVFFHDFVLCISSLFLLKWTLLSLHFWPRPPLSLCLSSLYIFFVSHSFLIFFFSCTYCSLHFLLSVLFCCCCCH